MKRFTRVLGVTAGLLLLGAWFAPAARADNYSFSFGYSSGGRHGDRHHGYRHHYYGHRGPYWGGSFHYSYAPRAYYVPAPPPRVVYRYRAPVYYYQGGGFHCY